jgi:hypothetical protein
MTTQELEAVEREIKAEGYWGVERPWTGYYELLTQNANELAPLRWRDGKPIRVPGLTDVFREIKEVFHRLRPEGLPDGAAWDGFNVTVRWVGPAKKKAKKRPARKKAKSKEKKNARD